MKKLQAILDSWQKLQPLTDDDRNRLSRKFTVDFNYNSNHIEGNTLTYGQTELLLLFGKVIGEADFRDCEEMKASNVGLQMMLTESGEGKQPLTQNFIRNLHRTLLREDYTVYCTLPGGVQTSYVVHAGRYKTRPNSVITRYGDRFDYASPEETPALMADLVEWYNRAEEEGLLSPIELAIIFHYRYIRIHPFEDGNGRIARLMVNYILSKHNYPMIVIRSRAKQEYLEALHRSDMIVGNTPTDGAHASLKEIRPFYKYMMGIIKKEIENDILFLTERDENIWWYDGERVVFRTPTYGKILRTLQREDRSTLAYLQELLGINRSAIQKMLRTLLDKGYITKDYNDVWRVVITPSI
jgi:Fic family protein